MSSSGASGAYKPSQFPDFIKEPTVDRVSKEKTGRITPIRKEGGAAPRLASQILKSPQTLTSSKPLPTPSVKQAFSSGDVAANKSGVQILTGKTPTPLPLAEKPKAQISPDNPIAAEYAKAKAIHAQAKFQYEQVANHNGTALDPNSANLIKKFEKQLAIAVYDMRKAEVQALLVEAPRTEASEQRITDLSVALAKHKSAYLQTSFNVLEQDIKDKIIPLQNKPNLSEAQKSNIDLVLKKFETLQKDFKTAGVSQQNFNPHANTVRLENLLSDLKTEINIASAPPIAKRQALPMAERPGVGQPKPLPIPPEAKGLNIQTARSTPLPPTPPNNANVNNNASSATVSSSRPAPRPSSNPLINRTKYMALRRERTERTELTAEIRTVLNEGTLNNPRTLPFRPAPPNTLPFRPTPPLTPYPSNIGAASAQPQVNAESQPPINQESTAAKASEVAAPAIQQAQAAEAPKPQKTAEQSYYDRLSQINQEVHTTEVTFNEQLKVNKELLLYFTDEKINNVAAKAKNPEEFAQALKTMLNSSVAIEKFSNDLLSITTKYEERLKDKTLSPEQRNQINLEYTNAITKLSISPEIQRTVAAYNHAFEKMIDVFKNEPNVGAAWIVERDNFLKTISDVLKTDSAGNKSDRYKLIKENSPGSQFITIVQRFPRYDMLSKSLLDHIMEAPKKGVTIDPQIQDNLSKLHSHIKSQTQGINTQRTLAEPVVIQERKISRTTRVLQSMHLNSAKPQKNALQNYEAQKKQYKDNIAAIGIHSDALIRELEQNPTVTRREAINSELENYENKAKEFNEQFRNLVSSPLGQKMEQQLATLEGKQLEKIDRTSKTLGVHSLSTINPSEINERVLNDRFAALQSGLATLSDSAVSLRQKMTAGADLGKPRKVLIEEKQAELQKLEVEVKQLQRQIPSENARSLLNTANKSLAEAKQNVELLESNFKPAWNKIVTAAASAAPTQREAFLNSYRNQISQFEIQGQKIPGNNPSEQLFFLIQHQYTQATNDQEKAQILRLASDWLRDPKLHQGDAFHDGVQNSLVALLKNVPDTNLLKANIVQSNRAALESNETKFAAFQHHLLIVEASIPKIQQGLIDGKPMTNEMNQLAKDLKQLDTNLNGFVEAKEKPDSTGKTSVDAAFTELKAKTMKQLDVTKEKFNNIESNFKPIWDKVLTGDFKAQEQFISNYRNEINKYEQLGKPIPGNTPSEKLFNLFSQEYKKATPEQREQILAMIGDWLSKQNVHMGDVTNEKVQASIKSIISETPATGSLAPAINMLKTANSTALRSTEARFAQLQKDLTTLTTNFTETKKKIAGLPPDKVSQQLDGKSVKEWVQTKLLELNNLEQERSILTTGNKQSRAAGKAEEVSSERLASLTEVSSKNLAAAKGLIENNHGDFFNKLMNPNTPKEDGSTLTKLQKDFLLTYRNTISKFEYGEKIPGKTPSEQLFNILERQMKQGSDTEKLQILGMIKEWVENPYINGGDGLEKNIQNQIHEILKNVTENSPKELKNAKEDLEGVLAYQSQLKSADFSTPLKNGTQAFDDLIKGIASKSLKEKDYDKAVQNFADDLKKTTFHHMGQLTSKDFVLNQSTDTRKALEDHINGVKNLAVQSILSQQNPKEAGRVLAFFVDVQQKLLEAAPNSPPDLSSAFMLSNAFANTQVENRVIQNVKLSEKQKETLTKYSIDGNAANPSIFNPTSGFKAAREYVDANPNIPIIFNLGFQNVNQVAEVLRDSTVKDGQINDASISSQAQAVRTDVEKMILMRPATSLTFDMKTPNQNLLQQNKTSDGNFDQSAFDKKLIAMANANLPRKEK